MTSYDTCGCGNRKAAHADRCQACRARVPRLGVEDRPDDWIVVSCPGLFRKGARFHRAEFRDMARDGSCITPGTIFEHCGVRYEIRGNEDGGNKPQWAVAIGGYRKGDPLRIDFEKQWQMKRKAINEKRKR